MLIEGIGKDRRGESANIEMLIQKLEEGREPVERCIKVSDRAAIVNLMIGMDGYTISSDIFPKYLQGDSIVSIPLEEDEVMHIGYILNKDKELSELGEIYVEALKQYQK